jgi:hypothetical protein
MNVMGSSLIRPPIRPPDQSDLLTYSLDLSKTPKSHAEVLQSNSWIDNRLVEILVNALKVTPTIGEVIQKRNKGSNTLQLKGQIAEEEIYRKAEEELKKKRRKNMNKVVQKYGVIFADEARLRIMVRNEEEDECKKGIQRRKDAREEAKLQHIITLEENKRERERKSTENKAIKAEQKARDKLKKQAQRAHAQSLRAEQSAWFLSTQWIIIR